MFDPPPPAHTAVRIYSATRKGPDGNDAVQGEMRMINGKLVGTGSGVGMIAAARRRLWGDATILRFYGAWSNGYVYTVVVD